MCIRDRYKPRGYVTTASDELGRKTVMDLVSDIPARLYPVGRLDKMCIRDRGRTAQTAVDGVVSAQIHTGSPDPSTRCV